jgi:hypothetical protein
MNRLSMFMSFRHYETSVVSVPEILRRLNKQFLPLLKQISGFESCDILDAGKGQLITITVFQTEVGALKSTQLADQWFNSLGDLKPRLSGSFSGMVVIHSVQEKT